MMEVSSGLLMSSGISTHPSHDGGQLRSPHVLGDLHLSAGQDLADIKLVGSHPHDGHASLLVSVLDGVDDRSGPPPSGQERSVNIDHTEWEALDNAARHKFSK